MSVNCRRRKWADEALGQAQSRKSPIKSQGTVKYWIKQGVLWKTETETAQDYGGDDYIESTTVTEFTNVGTTKITVPEEALKLLGR
ncbi:MAG TPA: hypothetical protein VNU68_24595 [Verrucomicrobiae bacterium]|nr:hypothetical protein [Verrucomicrobiae bacterium]